MKFSVRECGGNLSVPIGSQHVVVWDSRLRHNLVASLCRFLQDFGCLVCFCETMHDLGKILRLGCHAAITTLLLCKNAAKFGYDGLSPTDLQKVGGGSMASSTTPLDSFCCTKCPYEIRMFQQNKMTNEFGKGNSTTTELWYQIEWFLVREYGNWAGGLTILIFVLYSVSRTSL